MSNKKQTSENWKQYLTVEDQIQIRKERILVWEERNSQTDKKYIHDLNNIMIEGLQKEIQELRKKL